jgi:hypothetical protein
MEEEDRSVLSEVKIEIDVAEEPAEYWTTQQQGSGEWLLVYSFREVVLVLKVHVLIRDLYYFVILLQKARVLVTVAVTELSCTGMPMLVLQQ